METVKSIDMRWTHSYRDRELTMNIEHRLSTNFLISWIKIRTVELTWLSSVSNMSPLRTSSSSANMRLSRTSSQTMPSLRRLSRNWHRPRESMATISKGLWASYISQSFAPKILTMSTTRMLSVTKAISTDRRDQLRVDRLPTATQRLNLKSMMIKALLWFKSLTSTEDRPFLKHKSVLMILRPRLCHKTKSSG